MSSLLDQLETREDMASAILADLIEPSGDAIAGNDQVNKSVTYRLQTLSGPMLQCSVIAVQHPAQPVVLRCPENKSILLFNKCYGIDVTVPIRPHDKPETSADLHLVSVVRARPTSPQDMHSRFDTKRIVYMPSYGGTFTDPDDGKQYLKPALMDVETRDLMQQNGIGWMALWYVNSGTDEDRNCPTGIVALEGRAFAMPEDKTARPESYEADDETREAMFARLERDVKAALKSARKADKATAKKAAKAAAAAKQQAVNS